MKIMQLGSLVAGIVVVMLTSTSPAAAGDAEAGEKAFRACASCHSLVPNRHTTGPSLAGIWGRKAGSVDGFRRYSNALENADLVWDENTLDAWLTNPKALIPDNRMVFRGIDDADVRADLVAFLEFAASGDKAIEDKAAEREPRMPDLKTLESDRQVAAIRYCGDTYEVTTVSGKTVPYWEFNLRIKTDSSDLGPLPGHPALLPASMGGDRAFVIFANPAEISKFIDQTC